MKQIKWPVVTLAVVIFGGIGVVLSLAHSAMASLGHVTPIAGTVCCFLAGGLYGSRAGTSVASAAIGGLAAGLLSGIVGIGAGVVLGNVPFATLIGGGVGGAVAGTVGGLLGRALLAKKTGVAPS